ncbi:ABC transporter permease [Microbacterium sp. RD1]|uniref:ABC transporter permease n=1 Tax=Microbacterium sp. RD1 TaxID=3457313 RepID=UPI003FA5443C
MSATTDIRPPETGAAATFARHLPPARVAALAFIVLLLIGSLTTDGFYTLANMRAILNSAAVVGIIAVGAAAIVIGGNLFSMSLGTTVAVCAMAFLSLLGAGLVPAIIGTLVLGALIVGVQGYVVGRFGANPIIITIGAGALLEGAATWISGGTSVNPPPGSPDFSFLAAPLLGIPFPVYVFVVVVVLGEIGLRRSVFGRQLILMGASPKAARAAALPVTRLTTGAFVIAGVTAGIAGVLLGAFNQSGTLTTTGTLTYDAIAAVLVGGLAVAGGRGSVLQAAAGAILIAAVSDMLLLRGFSPPLQMLILGLIVGAVVVLNYVNSRTGEAR